MGGSKARTWAVITILVVVVVLVGGWFLAVSPQYAEASEIRDEVANVESQNEMLRIQNAELRRQFDELPATRTELADHQVRIPIEMALSDFQREIARVATETGVIVTDVQVSAAQDATFRAVEPAEPATPPAEEPAEGDANDDAEAAAEAPAPEPETSAGIDGLYSMQVNVTVFGPYPATRNFLRGMRELVDREYLVPSIAIAAQEASDSPGQGLPPIVSGDVKLTLSGLIFAMPAEPAFPPAEGEEPVEEVLPGGNDWNWWVGIPVIAAQGVDMFGVPTTPTDEDD